MDNKGLCSVSSMIILLQLTSVYLLCHQQDHGRHFGITFSDIMPCQHYFRCIKVVYYGIVLLDLYVLGDDALIS